MGRRGNPYDNAKAESFIKTLKVEAVYRMDYQTFGGVADDNRGKNKMLIVKSLVTTTAFVSLAVGLLVTPAQADDGFRLLHTFTGMAGGGSPGPITVHADPSSPTGWALYGAANTGGAGNGVVFKLTPPLPGSTHWSERRLYVFPDAVNGDYTFGKITFGRDGAIYGATEQGGNGGGTVYRLTPPGPGGYFWNRTVLHSFGLYPDSLGGTFPESGVILDEAGNVYGTTILGGANSGGVVYKLSPPASVGGQWTFTILHSFNAYDGQSPLAGLVRDPAGVLYGATTNGGVTNDGTGRPDGLGTVFSLAPPAAGKSAWTFSTLYTFTQALGFDGPRGTLLRAASGTLYGVGFQGYGDRGPTPNGGGVFKLTPPAVGQGPWTFKVLHFLGSSALQPGGLSFLDRSGALCGATAAGGLSLGLVYKLTPPAAGQTDWSYSVLHTFAAGQNLESGIPPGNPLVDRRGTIYGSTLFGGPLDAGTIYKIDTAEGRRWW